jgi:hypothetical protein
LNINFRNVSLRVTPGDDAAGGISLVLPRQNLAIPAAVVVLMFVVFAGVLVFQLVRLDFHALNSMFDWAMLLFNLFWLLGWSAGVLVLGALTIFLFFYKESARVMEKRLIYMLSIGPVKIIREYDLGLMRNLRVENEPDGKNMRLRFDYKDAASTLGNPMPQSTAERNLAVLNGAIDKLVFSAGAEF